MHTRLFYCIFTSVITTKTNIMTSSTKINQEKSHKLIAKTLRYAGYDAKAFNNEAMLHQPWEIRVKGIDSEEQNTLIAYCERLSKNDLINIVSA